MRVKSMIGLSVAILIITGCSTGEVKKIKESHIMKENSSIFKGIVGEKVLETRAGERIPAQRELFEKLAIIAKDKKQYAFGDNFAGYSSIYTHSYAEGELYNISGNPLIIDFATFSGKELNNRIKNTKEAKIYPYGSKTTFSNGSEEEFILYSNKNSISIVVSGDKKIQGIEPIMALVEKGIVTQKEDGVLLITVANKPAGYPNYIAVSADKDFNYENISNIESENNKTFRLNANSYKPLISTVNPESEFVVNFTFSSDKEKAIKTAKELAEKNGIAIHKNEVYSYITKSFLWTDDEEFNRALVWSRLSANSLVTEEYGRGIWAGLPWFRDNWGRDTFIAMPGTLLVNGELKKSKELITNFSKYQNRGDIYIEAEYKDKPAKDKIVSYIRSNFNYNVNSKGGKITNQLLNEYINKIDEVEKKVKEMNAIEGVNAKYFIDTSKNYGRVPNRVSRPEDIIYNTTDGTPWMIREIYEYIKYSGDIEYTKEIYPVVKLAIDSAVKNYTDEFGFLTHADADTWMDAKFDGIPWSARGNRANDIQALWFETLKIGVKLADYNKDSDKVLEWKAISEKLKSNFEKMFWDEKRGVIADRLTSEGLLDTRVRPNQLMLITIPMDERLLSKEKEAVIIKNSINELLFPYGILSLSQHDDDFHPYHITSEKYEKDAAYHNGTIWGWNAGFAISAMTKYGYQDFAYELTKNLTKQILEMGCLGTMSENLEAFPTKNGEITMSGTYSQAWSVAEFNRNAYQNYIGYNPDLIDNKISLIPAVPAVWKSFYCELPFNNDGKIIMDYSKDNGKRKYTIKVIGIKEAIKLEFGSINNYSTYKTTLDLKDDKVNVITFDEATNKLYHNEKEIETVMSQKSYFDIIGKLQFAKPEVDKKYNALENENYLRNKLSEKGKK